MRVFVLLALLVPTLATAKYEGARYQRDPITVAIVFASAHYDTVRAALDAVHAALPTHAAFDDAVDLGPARGSQAIVIGYDQGARVIAWTSLDDLRGDSLGPAQGERVGADLVTGVEVALAALAKSPHERRALIVIGDDGATDDNAASVALTTFRDRAYAFRIRVHGFRYPTPSRSNLFPLLTSDWQDAEPLVEKLPKLVHEIALEQPPIARPVAQRPAERKVPWFGLGVAACVVAITAGVRLARPRAAG